MKHNWIFEDIGYDLNMSFENIQEIEGNRQTLSTWLGEDVRDYRIMLDDVIKVLNGDSEYEELWCDLFTADVYKDYTEIHSNFEDNMPPPCKVPTPLLREIIEVWLEEREKYYANKK